MQTSSVDMNDKIDFIFLMTQIQTRNLKVQNFLFKINWSVLLTVSFCDNRCANTKLNIFR